MTYNERGYKLVRDKEGPKFNDLYSVNRTIVPPPLPKTVSTCYLDPGPRNDKLKVEFEECFHAPPTQDAVDLDKLCVGTRRNETQIPKRVIQVRLDGSSSSEPPEEMESRSMRHSWQIMHVDYEYIYYDRKGAKDFMARHYPLVPPILDLLEDNKLMEMWGDLVVYSMMYKYGGIYADVDTEALRSFDCLIRSNDTFVVGFDSSYVRMGPKSSIRPAATFKNFAVSRLNPTLKSLIELLFEKLSEIEDFSSHKYVSGVLEKFSSEALKSILQPGKNDVQLASPNPDFTFHR